MKKTTLIIIAAAMMMVGCKQKTEPVVADTDNIYQFSVLDGNLDTVSLGDYQGKVLLVVNTATQCGFTPQYEELQQLYEKYHDRGFEVLDFPCNQFGEPPPRNGTTKTGKQPVWRTGTRQLRRDSRLLHRHLLHHLPADGQD